MMKRCANPRCSTLFLAHRNRCYCSDKCKAQAYRDRKPQNGARNMQPQTVHSGFCKWCQSMHFWQAHVYKKYCCNAHKQAAYRAQKKYAQSLIDFGGEA